MHIWVYATQFKAMQALILDTMECAQALLRDCTAAFLFTVRVCVCASRIGNALGIFCVFDGVFRFQMEALQAVWGYCSVYPIVWLHPIRSLSLSLSLSLFLYFSLVSLPLRQVPGSGASTPSDQGTPRRAGIPLAGQAHPRQQVTRGSPCRR